MESEAEFRPTSCQVVDNGGDCRDRLFEGFQPLVQLLRREEEPKPSGIAAGRS